MLTENSDMVEVPYCENCLIVTDTFDSAGPMHAVRRADAFRHLLRAANVVVECGVSTICFNLSNFCS